MKQVEEQTLLPSSARPSGCKAPEGPGCSWEVLACFLGWPFLSVEEERAAPSP